MYLFYNINVLLKIVFKLDSRLTSKLLIYNFKSFMELPNQSGGRSSIIHITYISYFIIINQHSVSFSSSAFGFYQSIYKSRKTIPNTFSACVFLISYLKNFKYIQKRIEQHNELPSIHYSITMIISHCFTYTPAYFFPPHMVTLKQIPDIV